MLWNTNRSIKIISSRAPLRFGTRGNIIGASAAARLVLTTSNLPLVRSNLGSLRHYAQPPGGSGQGGGFPGFSMGGQHQKGDALKEYVRIHSIECSAT